MEVLNQLLAVDTNYLLIGLVVVFYFLEQLFSNQFRFTKRPHHFLHNALLMGLFMLANIFWATLIVFCIEWLNTNQVGLFYKLEIPLWANLILSVVLIDFVSYWYHRIAHKVPLLWRLHRVHHSDTSMDSTTNFRFHPLEQLFWWSSTPIVTSAIFGLDAMGIGLYFLVLIPFLIFEHTNLKFPAWLDKTLGRVITTPNLHKIHHEQDQYYTDSNFSDIFILWHRLFGTFRYKPAGQIHFGLKEFDEDKKQTFWYLLKSPFINIKRIRSEEIKK